jgi:hypothetical protein
MTSAELQTEQGEMWRTLFDEHHARLRITAEMLLRCHVSPESVLNKALRALEVLPWEESVEQTHAFRAVAEAAILYNRESANSLLLAEKPDPVKAGFPGISQIRMLPWPERAVYFLCGVLHYSYQDTALLLGMSDANIDQLYRFAAKRIRY